MCGMNPSTLWLVDGMALAYRAHFALAKKPIRTATGLNTSAIFGLVNTLLDLLDSHRPDHIAVCWDTSEPTPRHLKFPAYKAQRQQMPEELSLALEHLHRLLPELGFPFVSAPGWEADDIMGTLAKRAAAEHFTTYLVSSDKDLGQLVTPQILLYRPGRQGSDAEIWGPAEVCARWGISSPTQITDMLALMGDASDNIPGVPGIGEKTAAKLLAQYHNLEELLDHTESVPGKTGVLLRQYADQARLSKELATINCNIPLQLEISTLVRSQPNKDILAQHFSELEFNSIGRRVLGSDFRTGRGHSRLPRNRDQLPALKFSIQILHSTSKILATIESLRVQSPIAIIALPHGGQNTDPKLADLAALALATANGSYSFTWPTENESDVKKISEAISKLLAESQHSITGHDLKTTLTLLRWRGITCRRLAEDCEVLQAILDQDADRKLPHMLERYLGLSAAELAKAFPPQQSTQTEIFSHESVLGWQTPPAQETLESIAHQASYCLALHQALLEKFSTTPQLLRVAREIEAPLLHVLVEMEYRGIALDTNVLGQLAISIDQKLAALELEIRKIAGTEININSPKQLGTLLFEKLTLLDRPPRTKTGQYSTDEATLESLAHAHPVVPSILEHRELAKLKSTYINALPQALHPRTGRLHTSFSQVRAATGRLSSEHPNLQNIPIRTELGRAIRRAFIPSQPGWLLLSADYSQIELRVMAALSGDSAMIAAFRDGLDIHAATAARIHNVPLSDVTPEMRRAAKTVNFGIIYGISAFGLSQRLGIPRAQASRLISDYFQAYPGVRKYMDKAVEMARERGYAETLTGRRRSIPEINSSHASTRSAAERIAINTPIQGTAADMIKRAMIHLEGELCQTALEARLLLQVHDELLLEVSPHALAAAEAVTRRAMIEALPLPNDVPLAVDCGHGPDWFSAH